VTELTIRPLFPFDWEAVRRIYLEGIATGDGTFETAAPDWQRWDGSHRRDCRLVAETGAAPVAAPAARRDVIGWATLSPASTRRVYAGVAEVSVYVAESARGRGVGAALLAALVEASEEAGLWTLQAGIFPENAASLALHQKCGFRRVGIRERVGYGQGRWRDVVWMERRSSRVGVGTDEKGPAASPL
jgi:phosphinothricin acetyltransferase